MRVRPLLNDATRAQQLQQMGASPSALQWSARTVKVDEAVVAYLNDYIERNALSVSDLSDLDLSRAWSDPALASARNEAAALQQLTDAQFYLRASFILTANVAMAEVQARAPGERGRGDGAPSGPATAKPPRHGRLKASVAGVTGLGKLQLTRTATASTMIPGTISDLLRSHKVRWSRRLSPPARPRFLPIRPNFPASAPSDSVLVAHGTPVALRGGGLTGRSQTLVLLCVKLSVFKTFVEALSDEDGDESGKTIYLDRAAATESARSAAFLQVYRQLRTASIRRLRHQEQAWTVRFVREGAEDAGGPYRESMALLSKDLQSGAVPLLLPCPNAREGHGDNREKFVPNPDCRSAEELRMFRFLGRVVGLAMFTSTSLDVDLPSLIWKRLVRSPVNETDVEVRRGGPVGTNPWDEERRAATHTDRSCARAWRPRADQSIEQAVDARFVQTTLATMRGKAVDAGGGGAAVVPGAPHRTG